MGTCRVIDTKMHGFDQVTATFLVAGEKLALVETGPRSVVHNVLAGLEAAGVDHLDWIVLTHIHLDHAGAAGTLARKFPGARVAVHGIGAPHLVDPAKLWASASRIYGDRMEAMWGGIDPLDADRITVIEDGDTIDLGGRTLTAVETPGHAYHHHAYVDSDGGGVFTGDALGVRLPGISVIRPTSPPPEFHVEKAIASIGRLRDLRPTSLIPTHFGPVDADVDETCDGAIEAIRRWGEWVQKARTETSDLDEVTAIVEREVRADLSERVDEGQMARLEQTTSFRMNTSGYMRYYDKQEKAAREAAG